MTKSVLVAGVGNTFFGDDGFGVEVARALAERPLADRARVVDFGIRGLHLMIELLTPPDVLVIVDIALRGGVPGTLYLLAPEEAEHRPRDGRPDAHALDLPRLFQTLEALGTTPPKTLILACEPEDISPRMELSEAVRRAMPEAMVMVESLVERELRGLWVG